jgi:hypothetical protein
MTSLQFRLGVVFENGGHVPVQAGRRVEVRQAEMSNYGGSILILGQGLEAT